MIPPPPTSTLFPYTTLFRSSVSLLQRSVAVEVDRSWVGEGKPGRPAEIGALHSHRLVELDRKSTRLNSSHRCISYAVFCLKKEKKKKDKDSEQLYRLQ